MKRDRSPTGRRERATRSRRTPTDRRRRGRAISTVLDVGLCLVLVTAAVATVAGVHVPASTADHARPAAGETATTLSTATTTVTYSLSEVVEGSDRPSFPRTTGQGFTRSRHGTYASLLARAAFANLSLGDRAVAGIGDPFVAAVESSVRPLLVGRGWRAQVVARWTPHPGSDLAGVVRVGATPPPDSTVHAATVTVPSGVALTDGPPEAAAPTGFRQLGRALARGLVERQFPPERTRRALRGAYPEPGLTALRYRAFTDAIDADVATPVRAEAPSVANERLVVALADRLTAGLRDRYADPSTARERLDPGTVTIVVRTWSP